MAWRRARCAGQIHPFYSASRGYYCISICSQRINIILQHDTLSVVRSRLPEVSYAIRASLIAGSLSSEVSVMLPLRIMNNLSIDPPPRYPTPLDYSGVHASKPALPIATVGTKSACSILTVSPRFENLNGAENRTILDLCGRTVGFSEASGGVLEMLLLLMLFMVVFCRVSRPHVMPRRLK